MVVELVDGGLFEGGGHAVVVAGLVGRLEVGPGRPVGVELRLHLLNHVRALAQAGAVVAVVVADGVRLTVHLIIIRRGIVRVDGLEPDRQACDRRIRLDVNADDVLPALARRRGPRKPLEPDRRRRVGDGVVDVGQRQGGAAVLLEIAVKGSSLLVVA